MNSMKKRGVGVRNLFFKTLYDRRFFIIGWSLGLAFIGYVMTIFYPSLHSSGSISSLVKSLPQAAQGLVGNIDDFNHLATYLGGQLFTIRIPIFVSILSILLAVGLTVTEENKGQLRTLVALPVSRTHILFSKWGAIVLICAVASLAVVVGVDVGAWQIGEALDQTTLLQLVVLMWLLVVALASLIFAVGLATGSRGLTTAIGILVAIGSFLLTTFAAAVSWLKEYEKLSIFHYYPADDIARGTIKAGDILVYTVIIVISLLVAWLLFRRRDLR